MTDPSVVYPDNVAHRGTGGGGAEDIGNWGVMCANCKWFFLLGRSCSKTIYNYCRSPNYCTDKIEYKGGDASEGSTMAGSSKRYGA